jgi:hypothetical protein
MPGVTVKEETAKTGMIGVSKGAVETFDKVLIGNDVLIFGYPTSLGLEEIPQLDPLRPLLRKGLIAGQNPGKRSIVIDAPVYPGNSGGPVVQVRRVGPFGGANFSVIGVVRQLVPFVGFEAPSKQTLANSGYSIVTPMDFVLELVK